MEEMRNQLETKKPGRDPGPTAGIEFDKQTPDIEPAYESH